MGPPPHRSRQNSLPESDTTHHPGPKGQGTLFIIRSVAIASWAIAQKLGISPKTAERYSRLPDLPELAARLSDAVYWIPTSHSFWTGGTRGLESRAS